MRTHGIHRWLQISTCFRIAGVGRAVAHTAGLFVIAVTLAVAASRPAAAQSRIPIAVDFELLNCVDETGYDASLERHPDRHSDDEPYVIFFVADISARHYPIPSLRIPLVRVFRTSVFENVNDGDVRRQRVRLWGLTGSAAPLPNPDDVIFLVSLWEHNTSDVHAIAMEAAATLDRKLRGYMIDGLNRDAMVSRLINDWVEVSYYGARVRTATLLFDKMVGPPQELRPIQSTWDWDQILRGAGVWKVPNFTGWPGDGLSIHYQLGFYTHTDG